MIVNLIFFVFLSLNFFDTVFADHNQTFPNTTVSVSATYNQHHRQFQQNSEEELVTDLILARNRRIIGGVDTNIKHYPFMVAVLLFSGLNCGGTIINTKWIMTAAHCAWNFSKYKFFSPREIIILAGSTVWIPKEVDPTSQTRQVKLIRTINFQVEPAENDIALMMLTKELEYSETVKPIKLSTKSWFKDNYVQILLEPCETLGWGKDDSGSKSRVLKKVEANLIPSDFCQKLIHIQGVREKVTNSNICTLSPDGGKDFCKADSGGPLLCNNIQIGIVFGNFGCGLKNLPSLWTKVDYYEDWINGIVQPSNNSNIQERSSANIIASCTALSKICIFVYFIFIQNTS